MYLGIIYFLKVRGGLGNLKAATTKTLWRTIGPEGWEAGRGFRGRKRAQMTQDASFGPFVSYIFRVLLLLTTVLGTIYLREGRDHENGPKRYQTRRLGLS
jgi:hypothetical protein